MPVSSYTTSTPVAEYTRSAVWPVQLAPAYSALHMLTTNVCPALAVTPHMASREVSEFVFDTRYAPHSPVDVGRTVGTVDGAGEGAVGAAVGRAEGFPGTTEGLAVGSVEGADVGLEVVGSIVGMLLGPNEGRAVGIAVGPTVGVAEGDGVGILVGTALGDFVGTAEGAKSTAFTPAPATTACPVQVVPPTHPSRIT